MLTKLYAYSLHFLLLQIKEKPKRYEGGDKGRLDGRVMFGLWSDLRSCQEFIKSVLV